MGQVLRPHKGLTRIRPLSCGFASSNGRALHRHRRVRGFESRSEPENFFQVLVPVVLKAALAVIVILTILDNILDTNTIDLF